MIVILTKVGIQVTVLNAVTTDARQKLCCDDLSKSKAQAALDPQLSDGPQRYMRGDATDDPWILAFARTTRMAEGQQAFGLLWPRLTFRLSKAAEAIGHGRPLHPA